MGRLHRLAVLLILPFVPLTFATTACAADPGIPIPSTTEMSDQVPASVLVYNLYTSSVSAPQQQNSRITMTNVCPDSVAVHLFLVDGSSCTIADFFQCLTANQTTSFLAFDVDPGITGYLIAVTVDIATGMPVDNDCLIGVVGVIFAGSGDANLKAEGAKAMMAAGESAQSIAVAQGTAQLDFDGIRYSRFPRVLAVSSISSRVDGNQTRLIINRVGGDLAMGVPSIGSIFGVLFDEAEEAHSFSINVPRCQLVLILGNGSPRTVPPFDTIIPAGASGWMKFWAQGNGVGLLGSVLVFNPNVATSKDAFSGGRNLHHLSLEPRVTLTIPVFPPHC